MPKENKIRILYVQPGKYPEERIIDNTLKAYQSLVYGDIESVAPWRTNVRVVCNQEGKLNGMRRIVCSEITIFSWAAFSSAAYATETS